MELVDINREIYDATQRLRDGSKKLFSLARKAAEGERSYRKALSMEIMKLRLDKLPATLIPDIAKGNVSDLLFERDLSEAEWTAGRDSLKAIQAQVNALQTITKYQSDINK